MSCSNSEIFKDISECVSEGYLFFTERIYTANNQAYSHLCLLLIFFGNEPSVVEGLFLKIINFCIKNIEFSIKQNKRECRPIHHSMQFTTETFVNKFLSESVVTDSAKSLQNVLNKAMKFSPEVEI